MIYESAVDFPGIPCLNGEPQNLVFYADTEAGIMKTYKIPGRSCHIFTAESIPEGERPDGVIENDGLLFRVLRGRVSFREF